MSELEQLSNIIDVILSKDNAARKEGEATLKGVMKNNLDKYNQCFITLLQESPQNQVRMFCAVHLRTTLSNFSDVNKTEGNWYKLSGDTQKLIKDSLFAILEKEQDNNVRRALCDLIGEVGATCFMMPEDEKEKCHEEGMKWSDLIENTMALIQSSSTVFIQCGLKIFAILFLYASEEFSQYAKDFMKVFQNGMEHEDDNVKAAAMEALASYCGSTQHKYIKNYTDLIPIMMKQLVYLFENNEDIAIECLGHFTDVIETEPKIIKPHFKDLFQMIKILYGMNLDTDGIKRNFLETMVICFESITKFTTTHKDIMKELIEMIFSYMIDCEEELDEDWMTPKEGFVEADIKDDSLEADHKLGMHFIDRLIAISDQKISIPILSDIIIEMAKYDWKYKHSALMALSQVGEFVQDVSDMEPIINFILKFLEDQHCKVRFAALHCIGQISDDMKPAFQKKYHSVILPALINATEDKVQRCVSHTFAAFTNFLEETPYNCVQEHAIKILELCISHLESGCSIVKENVLSAIAALAECMGKEFTQYWQRTADIVFSTYNSHTGKVYRQIRGQCVEALTIIGVSVGKNEFKKAANEIINMMKDIQEQKLEDDDPQRGYIVTGWQRICMTLEEDFIPYLEEILPQLLKVIDQIIQSDRKRVMEMAQQEVDDAYVVEQGMQNNKMAPSFQANTSDSDELLNSLNMINSFITHLKNGYLNFVEETSNIILPVLDYRSNNQVRYTAAKALPLLIEVVQASKHPETKTMVKSMANVYVKNLWAQIDAEYEPKAMQTLVLIMRSVIASAGNYMTQDQMKEITDKIISHLGDSIKRKQDNENYGTENKEDLDEDEFEALKDENDVEDEFNCALAELIGGLFESHKEMALHLVDTIYQEILPNVLTDNVTSKMNRFGLFLVDDMIEYLGIEYIPKIWPEMADIILNFAVHKVAETRQAAVYGIGVLAEKSQENFKPLASRCLEALYKALSMKKCSEDTEKTLAYARDNTVAAMGKILKSQSEALGDFNSLLNTWLQNLPLKKDKPEARVQHNLLLDIILEANATLIFGEKGENMQHVFQIFAEIVNTKLSTDSIKEKIIRVLNNLSSESATQAIAMEAASKLEEKYQKKLQDLMKEASG